ncbi:MAG: hypothetical protein HYT76_00580 [Deltaproteobacteria bacterium]|nr:hypothetical protein [Deltaproteobacteria bacterium]
MFFFLKLFFVVVISLSASVAHADQNVGYDRGIKGKERSWIPAEGCTLKPCVITQWGAIRLPKEFARTYRIEMGGLHRGNFRSIAIFQESSSFEQKLSERVFNRQPNRKIVNLERLIETGKTNTIYMYGLLLQYEFDEGDLLGIKFTSLKNPNNVQEYFFRYHHDGTKWDIDFAFIQPINIFHPNPNGVLRAAYSTGALSFSFARAMDPDKHYSFLSKAMRAVRVNLFTGILLRREVAPLNGDNIVEDRIDAFGGLGLTFLDFIALGYGGTMANSPRTTFPFVGIEIRHLMEFLRTLKKDTHSRWQRYLKEEMERTSSEKF